MTRTARTALAIAGISLISGAYVAGRHAAYAQTQLEMNEQANRDFLKQDAKMTALYSKLLHTYDTKNPSTAPTHKKIIAAEKAWATYRDAEADMEASMEAEGGSLYPQLDCLNCTSLTDERIKRIKAELKEINSR